MSTPERYAAECCSDYIHYRGKCKASQRGDGVHDLWVKLAWVNRQQARQWISEPSSVREDCYHVIKG